MGLDQLPRNRQPESRSAPFSIRAEGLKQSVQDLRGNARAVVGNEQLHACRDFPSADRHDRVSSPSQRLGRVPGQVPQDAGDPIRIQHDL